MGGKSSKPPPPPNYAAAAREESRGDMLAAQQATEANRVNQVTPYGDLTYTRGEGEFHQEGYDAAMQRYNRQLRQFQRNGYRGQPPVPPNRAEYTTGNNTWTATQTLSPEQQQLLDANQQLQLGMTDLAGQGLEQARDVLSNPNLDTSGLPDWISDVDASDEARQQAQDAIYNRATRYLDPQYEKRQAALETQLANQGLARGTEAFGSALDEFTGQRDLAYADARDRAIMGGNQEFQADFGRNLTNANLSNALRGSMLGEEAYLQDRPLNLINALRTGNQVQGPQFINPAQQGQTAGPNVMDATNALSGYNTDVYNSGVASDNARNQQYAQTAATVAGLFMMSDRRLKSNVVRVGNHQLGIGIYEYDIFGERQRGVMADEVERVLPEAVMTGADGYKRVNYAAIGGV